MNSPWGQEVWYHYDLEDPPLYRSKNNRLMYEELMNSGTLQLVSTTYYEYSADGNVTRVITEQPAAPAEEQFMAAGAPSLDASRTLADPDGTDAVSAAMPSGDGAAAMAAAPPTGPQYSAVRLGYAANGRTVTFAHGETWTGSSDCPSDYQIPWAREFRYDGARARYMNAPLNPATMALYNTTQKPTVWSDYDGDEIYGDFEISGSPAAVSNTNSYESGLWRRLKNGTTFVPEYLHGDMLGTLRVTTGTTGAASGSDVFTAFGERQAGNPDRFGFVGAWGYQSTPIPESPNSDTAFPFLHVGARYYDPSTGRFLQRDPIGIVGGRNVYLYAKGFATAIVDPDGMYPWGPTWDIDKCKGYCGGKAGGQAARPGPGGKLSGSVGYKRCAECCTMAEGERGKYVPNPKWDPWLGPTDDFVDPAPPPPPPPGGGGGCRPGEGGGGGGGAAGSFILLFSLRYWRRRGRHNPQ